MRAFAFALLAACCFVSGCASGVVPMGNGNDLNQILTPEGEIEVAADEPRALSADVPMMAAAPPGGEVQAVAAQLPWEEHVPLEEVEAPRVYADDSPFKPGPGEADDIDRFARAVADVPVDIRPTEGELPIDLAAERLAEDPFTDEGGPPYPEASTVCQPTPWTLCFRPLYFEEVNLERYGCHHGIYQSAISGTQFFTTFAALPYKMRVRPPRSCVCSNGASRCGDENCKDYGRWYWRWDAALVELGAVTGVVYFLP